MASWGPPLTYIPRSAQCLMDYLRRGEGGPPPLPLPQHDGSFSHWSLPSHVIPLFLYKKPPAHFMFFKLMDDPVLNPEAQQGILMKRNTHQNGIQQFICLHWCPTSRHRVQLSSQRRRWHWSSEPSKRLAFAIGDQFFWKVKDHHHLLLGTGHHVTGRLILTKRN